MTENPTSASSHQAQAPTPNGLPANCELDGCLIEICDGPHFEVQTSLGFELLRYNQKPLGRTFPHDLNHPHNILGDGKITKCTTACPAYSWWVFQNLPFTLA